MQAAAEIIPIRTRKPRGQGATRRGEILDAAKRLFVEEGFEHATMRRIASIVGVSPTAIYMHFADKEAILVAISQDVFAELLVQLEASQHPDDPPLRRLNAGLRCYVEFGRARPDEYRLVFFTRMFQGGGRPCPRLEIADRSFGILESGVTELIQAGIFHPASVVAVSEAIWVCLHGLTTLLIDQPENLLTPPDELIQTVINMAIAGFLAPSTPGHP